VRDTAVRWGSPSHAFELESPDPRILGRATVVLGPWALPAAARPVRRWTVDPGPGPSEAWRIGSRGQPDRLVEGPARQAVTAVEFLGLQALLEEPPEVLTLHAALVARSGRGVLVLGPGEAGKSTLACALWRRGADLLGDDVAVVDAEREEAWSAPRRVGLRASSRALVGPELWGRIERTSAWEPTADGCLFHPQEVDGRSRPAAVRLRACVFLARREAIAGPAVALPLEPAHALLALLPYSNLVRQADPGDVLPRLAPLVRAVPAYDLGRGPLAAMALTVERLLDDEA